MIKAPEMRLSWITWMVQSNHKGPYKRETEAPESKCEEGTEVGEMGCEPEEGALRQGLQEASRRWKK